MKKNIYCIIPTEVLEKNGYDTSRLRKSVDGLKAVIHEEQVTDLVKSRKRFERIKYEQDSEEFKELLSSAEWSQKE